MTISNPTTTPEQGQIVTVRQRRYAVTDVQPSTLPPSPLTPQTAPQHLVTLNSIEDDAPGESLQVVWELEPGAQISERVELPEPVGFESPQGLRFTIGQEARWDALDRLLALNHERYAEEVATGLHKKKKSKGPKRKRATTKKKKDEEQMSLF